MNYRIYNWTEQLFGDALLKHLEITKHTVQLSTYNGYIKYANRIADWFNEREIMVNEICPEIIEDYYQYIRSNRVSENTVKHYHVLIHKFCKFLYNRGYIVSNPAEKVDKPRPKKYVANYYNEEQAALLLSIVKEKYMDYLVPIELALVYGLRRSEVCGLQWQCVDLKKRTIYINGKVVSVKKNENNDCIEYSHDLKSESSRRRLPISKDFSEYLSTLKNINTRPSDFVFTLDNGKPVQPENLTKMFNKIIQDNNLPHIRFHDLRHSCATILINEDVPVKFVQAWLGHSCYSTTADIYSHVYEKSKDSCINTMCKVLENR